jgi:uncharacterized protein (DUF1697 family)
LAFEELGFADVVTYIQSGNVLFRAPREKRDQLSARIESGLTSGLRTRCGASCSHTRSSGASWRAHRAGLARTTTSAT